jgi:hypothetical protein
MDRKTTLIRTFKFCSTLFLLINVSCSINDNNDRHEGQTSFDPSINFKKYTTLIDYPDIYYKDFKTIDTLQTNDTLYLSVGEYNRSDGKSCPLSNVYATFKTAKGDREFLRLDEDNNAISPGGQIKFYRGPVAFKIVSANIVRTKISNGTLEINENGDLIIAEYHSYWNNNIVRDTLIYRIE